MEHRIGNEPETLAVDEKLCAELADVEANPLGELSLPGMSDVRKKRAKQLAFMLMVRTKNRANPDDHETERSSEWTRDLETISGSVGVGEQRSIAMLTQLLQCPLTGIRGRALKEWECLARQHEAHDLDYAPGHNESSNTGHTTHRIQSCADTSD